MDTSKKLTANLEQLIKGYTAGNQSAENAIYELAYIKFKQIARELKQKSVSVSDNNNEILKVAENTTSVVHEAFIKLKQTKHFAIQNAQSFFNYFSQCIYSVLIDQARKQLAKKRDFESVNLEDAETDNIVLLEQLIDVHAQLMNLKTTYPRQVFVFIQKYVCAYTLEQIADLQDVSVSTIEKDLKFIRQLLFSKLN